MAKSKSFKAKSQEPHSKEQNKWFLCVKSSESMLVDVEKEYMSADEFIYYYIQQLVWKNLFLKLDILDIIIKDIECGRSSMSYAAPRKTPNQLVVMGWQ